MPKEFRVSLLYFGVELSMLSPEFSQFSLSFLWEFFCDLLDLLTLRMKNNDVSGRKNQSTRSMVKVLRRP